MSASAARGSLPAYVLVTPARNEERNIANTLDSVISQTHRPRRWVVVDDNSIDGTADIVRWYARRHPFIECVRSESGNAKHFGSKVRAFRAGYAQVAGLGADFVGNLDADVSFDPGYFERLITRMQADRTLGVAGGMVLELIRERFVPQSISLASVAGAVQLFRREAFDTIGGFIPLPLGGEDTVAEVMVRMHGWTSRTFPDLRVRHHGRVTMGGRNVFVARFRKGMANYAIGYDALFQLLVGLRRAATPPLIVGGILMNAGYLWAALRSVPRPVPPEVVTYLRCEQRHRLRHTLRLAGHPRASVTPGPALTPPSPR